jgi:23S rRNA pseudouridine2457 synthase
MISQFSREGDHTTLADLDYKFTQDIYSVGRLDSDSEGLLLLTNDKRLNERLLNPSKSHWRTYLIQVEGEFTSEAKINLEKGVEINVNGKLYFTKPSKVNILLHEPFTNERFPPIRFRKSVPTSWIEISLIEGKNRQVRKMTAKVGYPTLRLIRIKIGNLEIGSLKPGEVKEITQDDLFRLLFS